MVCRVFRSMMEKARAQGLCCDPVYSVGAGCDHMVVCMDGNVFTFGSGADGQLGHGVRDILACEDKPRLLDADTLRDEEVVGVAAGGNVTVVWTKGGRLYTFGCAWDGQLGHGDWLPCAVPERQWCI